jgi:4-amino-4-deoxy-L-arabinose transferase-like glycosyltransferase
MSFSSFAPLAPRHDRLGGLQTLYANPLPWLLLLAAAHVAVRVAISPALKWDEAQQILWSQELALGYGAQPPLYTWLQWGVNQLFGPSVLAVSLLKQTLIALTCVFMWLAARELMGRRAAWWAAASLWALPPFGWYSIRDQTHTVLVTAMTCAAWWLLLRIMRREGRGGQRDFIALGLVCGFGMLSKYNFALMLGAFAVALLSVRETRRALLGRGWWWAVLIALALFAPHAEWLLRHWHEATVGTFRQMDIQTRGQWAVGVAQGFGNLALSSLGTLGLWGIFALAAFGSAWRRRPAAPESAPSPSPAWLRPVFGRYLALIAVALALMVLAAGVTVFKGRWVLPLLAPAPLMALALRPGLEWDPRGWRLTVLTLGLCLVILVAAGARPWIGTLDGSVDELNHSAAQLGRALKSAGYDGRGRIIAADHMLAGMLRTRFPAAPADFCRGRDGPVTDCVAASVGRAESAGLGWLVISRADRLEADWWSQALARLPGGDALPRGNLRIPFLMTLGGHEPASYDFAWHPPKPQQP